MVRPFGTRGVLATLLVLAAGCQDYNFNPVGQCLIQPGSRRVTLSNISTADVLFVIDESGSMGGEQAALRDNFSAFVNNLDEANAARAAAGLDPIDFHLAVTTTSVFWNEESLSVCRNDCPGAVGQPVCCTSNTPDLKPRACGGPGGACPSGSSCRLDCNGFRGEFTCCSGPANAGVPALSEVVPCSAARVGTMCGSLATHYDLRGCPSRIAPADFWPYPAGDFVSYNNGGLPAAPNPRVVHFDKRVYPPSVACQSVADCGAGEVCYERSPGAFKVCRRSCTGDADCTNPFPGEDYAFRCEANVCQPRNQQGFTANELMSFFTENVEVGVCGSGQEQALQAARLALQKALAGQQRDTYGDTTTAVWTPPTASQLPASAPARWPNPNSKVVLVFVGDEDDCSSPADPSGGVVWTSDAAANDACQRDGQETTPEAIRNKQYKIQEFVSYFTSLGRPVAAAFILPAAQESCTLQTCTTAGLCCHPTLGCNATNGAQSSGHRLLATAQALAQGGVEVVAGSVCDANYENLLTQIAEIVKPPSGLTLPTVPAENEVTLLRIASASGQTRKVCSRPAPAGLSLAAAQDARDAEGRRYDWWFTADGNPGGSVAVSRFVYINPRGSCIANPGETYSADYLGRLPEGGCRSDAQCQTTLGGAAGSWTCFAGVTGDLDLCVDPSTSEQPGTCLCGEPSKNCPNGYASP
jgi:hypothetical protein